MARQRIVSESKKRLVGELIREYGVESIADMHVALKDLFGNVIQGMLESEFDEHMGYDKNERTNDENQNYRNGMGSKTLNSTYGKIPIDVPRDRTGEFEPKIIPKRKKDISEIENKIINMYAIGISTRQISEQIKEIYGFDVSADMVSSITDKILPEIEEWKVRPLDSVYPIVFIDAIHFSVRDNGVVIKKAAYIVLAITNEGRKDIYW